MHDPMDTTAPAGPSRRAERGWLAAGSLLAVALLAFGTVKAVSVLAHEERTVVEVVDARAVRVLVVESEDGSIEVRGADVDEITVTARISEGLGATRFGTRIEGDQLRIDVGCPGGPIDTWCGVDLVVEVPRRLEVDVHSEGDRVTVVGVDGRVEASSDDGPVEGEDLAGVVDLQSDNGSVRGRALRSSSIEAESDNGSVRVDVLVAPRAVIARSDNGSVEVVVPDDEATYAVDASSDNGRTTISVRTDPSSDRRIEAHSDNGSVTVRS